MSPTARDPGELLVVLDPEQRRSLHVLLADITDLMRAQLRPNESPSASTRAGEPWPATERPTRPPRTTGEQLRAVQKQQQTQRLSAKVVAARTAAVRKLDEWRHDALKKSRAVLEQKDDEKIREQRNKRRTELPPGRRDEHQEADAGGKSGAEQDPLVSLAEHATDAVTNEARVSDPADDVALLRTHYSPVPTPLAALPRPDRTAVLSAILLILLSDGAYSAYSRTLLVHLASSLGLPLSALLGEETAVAETLIAAADKAEKKGKTGEGDGAASPHPAAGGMSAAAEAAKRKQQNQTSRFWKVGLASVAGAAVIGITGGLAAPVVAGAIGGLMGGVGLGGVASFLGVFWLNGALVGTLFGAYGAKMTGERMDKYAREVEDFSFVPLDPSADKTSHRLRLTVGVNGWLTSEDDIALPWRPLLPTTSEIFALRYELSALVSLGSALRSHATSYAWGAARNEILRRTVLASVWAAMWPAALLSGAASALDNPFAHAMNRSTRAGKILADALAARVQGERPVTLVGYSLGAAVVCACLEELAKRRVFGVVETVVLVGAPARVGRDYWEGLASVVSGRIFNVYSSRDYVLGFLYRAHGLSLGIAGLQAVEGVERVANLNLTEEVNGHLRYPDLMPQILTRCGFPNVAGGQKPIEKDELPEPAEDEPAGQDRAHESSSMDGQDQPTPSPEPEVIKKSRSGPRFPKELGEHRPPAAASSSARPGPKATSSGSSTFSSPRIQRNSVSKESSSSSSSSSSHSSPASPRSSAFASEDRMILGPGRASLDGRPLPDAVEPETAGGRLHLRGGGPGTRIKKLERITSSYDHTHMPASFDECSDEEFAGIRLVDKER